jgi:hypothetical protein
MNDRLVGATLGTAVGDALRPRHPSQTLKGFRSVAPPLRNPFGVKCVARISHPG